MTAPLLPTPDTPAAAPAAPRGAPSASAEFRALLDELGHGARGSGPSTPRRTTADDASARSNAETADLTHDRNAGGRTAAGGPDASAEAGPADGPRTAGTERPGEMHSLRSALALLDAGRASKAAQARTPEAAKSSRSHPALPASTRDGRAAGTSELEGGLEETADAARSIRRTALARGGQAPAAPRETTVALANERGGLPAATDAGIVKDTKPLGAIAVTRRETHLAPVRTPDAIEMHFWERRVGADPAAHKAEAAKPSFAALADQIKPALEAASPESDTRSAPQTGQSQASTARPPSPVRVVELSLQPASLGAVAVTMRLTGTGLRVTVNATVAETAEALAADRDALASLIAGAGYDASEVVVRHRPAAATTARPRL